MADDNIQHGIDDDPNNDPHKAKNIGGVGGAVTGAIAGAAAGPLGAVGGAIVGGVVGAVASKEAVKVVDRMDNDNTITGIGHGATTDVNHPNGDPNYRSAYNTTTTYRSETGDQYAAAATPTGAPNGVPGIQTGGHDYDGSPDTRGIMEKTADTLTGDNIDDKTGKPVNGGSYGSTYGTSNAGYTSTGVPNGVPGIQTGGHDVDGTPDSRGIMEKTADALTGDNIDDKTGKPVR